jgi:hypothetical protein
MTQPIGYDNAGRPIFPTRVTNEQLEAGRQAHARRIAAAVAERERQEAEHKAEAARREAEAGTAELEAYREQAKAAWLSSGGTAVEFSDNWPRLKRDYLAEAAKEKLTRHERLVAQSIEELKATGRYSM